MKEDNNDICTKTRANITHTPTFLKLTEQTFGEIIINTSAITFIDIDACKVCVHNTDVYGNGMVHLTKDSMKNDALINDKSEFVRITAQEKLNNTP